MRSTKTTFHFFTIPQYKQEERYLQTEHLNGWKFESVSLPGLYHFSKCEPEEVTYQLDYHPDHYRHSSAYQKIYSDCGWEHICDFVGYSYFRKPEKDMHGDEEIFSDDQSKLDMVSRVFKGRMIPLLLIFAFLICPQIYLQYSLHGSISNILFILYVGLFLLYLVLFIFFAIQYARLYNRIHSE